MHLHTACVASMCRKCVAGFTNVPVPILTVALSVSTGNAAMPCARVLTVFAADNPMIYENLQSPNQMMVSPQP